MNRIISILIFAGFIFTYFQGISQNMKIDSLNQLLENTSYPDTSRIKTLNNLSYHYRSVGEMQKSLEIAEELKELSLEVSKSKDSILRIEGYKGIVRAYTNIGAFHWINGDLEKALDYFKQGLEINDKIKFKKGVANSYSNIALIYRNQGKYEQALENNLKALEMYEEMGDKSGMSSCYNKLGIIYDDQSNYEKAEEYYGRYLELCKELEDQYGIASGYNNLGLMKRYKKEYEQALEYFRTSLRIYKSIDNKNGVALACTNIGMLFTDISKDSTEDKSVFKGELQVYNSELLLDSALFYQKRALAIQEEIGDKHAMSYSLSGIGWVLKKKKDWKEALKYYKRAAEICEKIGNGVELYLAYQDLSEVYEEMAMVKHNKSGWEHLMKALEYHKKYAYLKDSIFNLKSNEQLLEMETKYETHKKEKEIELLNKEHKIDQLALAHSEEKIKNEERLIFFLGAICVFVIVMIFLVYNRYRIKKEANSLLTERNEEIQQQAEEIRAQHDALTMVNEQLSKKNLQISDSINYAKKIQRSVLTSEGKFRHYFPNSVIFNQPKDVVSGDFFWVKREGENIFFAVADCTGHGVPGAFMSLVCHRLLERAVTDKHYNNTSEILIDIHNQLEKILNSSQDQGKVRDGMDISICMFNRGKKELLFSGAHNSGILMSGGEMKILEADNKPIGYTMADKKLESFQVHRLSVNPGDMVYLFSDGFSDQFGGDKNQKFYDLRFYQYLQEISENSIEVQQEMLEKKFADWKGKNDQMDDVMVVGVQI